MTISEMRDFRTMVKVRVNGFDHTGHLATSSAFNSGKVDTVTIDDPFIDLNHMGYTLQYDSTCSTAQSRLVINEKPISIFQDREHHTE